MRYLTLGVVVDLHRAILEQTGGAGGIRDLGLLDSALAQPKATFGGSDLHATVVDKAAALCVSLVQNHPFVDGNKRIGHATMETLASLALSRLNDSGIHGPSWFGIPPSPPNNVLFI